MDIIEEAIEDAKKNAKQHGFLNTMYVTGKSRTGSSEMGEGRMEARYHCGRPTENRL
ncbi:hypothetical protein GCM10020331_014170 [Ectobacillus funiculus]